MCHNINQVIIDWSIFLPVLTTSLTIISSIIIWACAERNKRKQELYIRKENKYLKLIQSLKGFQIGSENKKLKQEFLDQLNLCWMYCPDSIIKKAYDFLLMLNPERTKEPTSKELKEAIAKLILEIRMDLINNKSLTKTSLTENDFKLLSAI